MMCDSAAFIIELCNSKKDFCDPEFPFMVARIKKLARSNRGHDTFSSQY